MALPTRGERDMLNILESITDGFVVIDADGRYAYVNKEAAALSGNTPRKLLGRKLVEAHPGFRESRFYRKYRLAVRTRKKLTFQHYYHMLGKWYDITVYPAAEGALSIYFRDITSAKSMEAKLRETEEQARVMLEHIKDYAIFLLDPEGRVRSWNPGAERLYGYTAKQIIGKRIELFYEPEEQARGAAKTDLTVAARKGRIEREARRVRKNGSVFWSNEIITAARTELRELAGFILVTRDITERKESREALEERTRDLEFTKDIIEREKVNDEALLNSIGEGVIATDAEGNVVLINRQAQAMLGIPESRALGRHFSRVWQVEDDNGRRIAGNERPLALAIRTGKKVTNAKCWYVSEPYIRFPAAATATPIIYNKKTLGAVMVFRNIEKEKEIDRAKSEFVSLASHQLRTPLTAIKLFADMLLRGTLGPLTDQQKDIVRSMETSNEKMINLVNALLNVSRIESGRLRPRFEPIDLPLQIEEILTDAHAIARERECTVRFRGPANTDLPPVVSDPSLLRQVIANLVNNAIQYSPAKRTVTVTLQKKPDGYVVNVRDQGIGIPKKARPRIFERFFRTPGAIKKKTDGTGLGLYMSRMMIELLGGRIWFKSQERKGTTFSISIPFAPAGHGSASQ